MNELKIELQNNQKIIASLYINEKLIEVNKFAYPYQFEHFIEFLDNQTSKYKELKISSKDTVNGATVNENKVVDLNFKRSS